MIDAGRVGFLYKFEYDATAEYEPLDVVLYDSSLWTPKQKTVGNPPPDQPVDDSEEAVKENEYWQLCLPGALGRDYVKKSDIAVAPTKLANGKIGLVYPDGKTILIDENGMLSGGSLDFTGTQAEAEAGIKSGELEEGTVLYLNDVKSLDGETLATIDEELSETSKNPVENQAISIEFKVIKDQLEDVRTNVNLLNNKVNGISYSSADETVAIPNSIASCADETIIF